MPGKKYDTDYMDSPLEAGAPYKMKGHTLPGIKQNPRTANMFAGENGPFLKNGIGSKIKKGFGKAKDILFMSQKEKMEKAKNPGAKAGEIAAEALGGVGSSFPQKTIHGKFEKKIEYKRPQAHMKMEKFIDPNVSKLKEGAKAGVKTGGAGGSAKEASAGGFVEKAKGLYEKFKSMKPFGGGPLAR